MPREPVTLTIPFSRFMAGPCRSCGQRIVWVETERGRRMPVDAEPVPGHFVITHGPRNGAVATQVPVYVSHFSTCPNADQHRGKGAQGGT